MVEDHVLYHVLIAHERSRAKDRGIEVHLFKHPLGP